MLRLSLYRLALLQLLLHELLQDLLRRTQTLANPLRLSKLEELYDNGDSVTAMKLLRQKNYLHIDSKYTVKPDHPNVVWFQEKVSEVLQRARRCGVN